MNFVCESALRKMKIKLQSAVTFTGQYSHMDDSATDLANSLLLGGVKGWTGVRTPTVSQTFRECSL